MACLCLVEWSAYHVERQALGNPWFNQGLGQGVFRGDHQTASIHPFPTRPLKDPSQKWLAVFANGQHGLGTAGNQGPIGLGQSGGGRVLHAGRFPCSQGHHGNLGRLPTAANRTFAGLERPHAMGSCHSQGMMRPFNLGLRHPSDHGSAAARPHQFPAPRAGLHGCPAKALERRRAQSQAIPEMVVVGCHVMRHGPVVAPLLRRQGFQRPVFPGGRGHGLVLVTQSGKRRGMQPLTPKALQQCQSARLATIEVSLGVFGLA